MADEGQDIFGKIDAILGKRAGFAGKRTALEDDFPTLTEVVSELDKAVSISMATDAMASPEAQAVSQQNLANQVSHLSEVDIDRLAAALEARLTEFFIRQQLRSESLIRRIVREELTAREGTHPPRL
jgi:hypothetical protein